MKPADFYWWVIYRFLAKVNQWQSPSIFTARKKKNRSNRKPQDEPEISDQESVFLMTGYQASPPARLLSVQSSVIWGFVGNEAASLVHARLGHHALRLDTVRLAAHPGHGSRFRHITAAGDMRGLLQDFAQLPVAGQLDAVQSGYFGEAGQPAELAAFLNKTKPPLYLLDPVLGDHGQLYVAPEIAEALRDTLVRQADIVTPNAFELSWLTGLPVTDLAEAERAAACLLESGPGAVLATGIDLPGGQIVDLLLNQESRALFSGPAYPQGVSGAGDILAALLLGLMLAGQPLEKAAEKASHITRDMIARAPNSRDMDLANQLELVSF